MPVSARPQNTFGASAAKISAACSRRWYFWIFPLAVMTRLLGGEIEHRVDIGLFLTGAAHMVRHNGIEVDAVAGAKFVVLLPQIDPQPARYDHDEFLALVGGKFRGHSRFVRIYLYEEGLHVPIGLMGPQGVKTQGLALAPGRALDLVVL
jgi:hypothetical protein